MSRDYESPASYRCWWLVKDEDSCYVEQCDYCYVFHFHLCMRVPGNYYKGWEKCRNVVDCPIGMQKKEKLKKD